MEKSEILQQWIEAAIPDPFLFQQRRAVTRIYWEPLISQRC